MAASKKSKGNKRIALLKRRFKRKKIKYFIKEGKKEEEVLYLTKDESQIF